MTNVNIFHRTVYSVFRFAECISFFDGRTKKNSIKKYCSSLLNNYNNSVKASKLTHTPKKPWRTTRRNNDEIENVFFLRKKKRRENKRDTNVEPKSITPSKSFG